VQLPGDLQRQLLDQTEGWTTGLRLAAMFASRTGHPERLTGFTGDDGGVAGYLVDEMLASLPAERRRFLLRTSVVDRLSGKLADALSGSVGGQRELEALERANAFVVSLGPGHRWFRYHPLLADVLRHQLLLEQPDLLPVLHRRAARWFAAQGDALEAIRQAVRARDWDLVAEIVTTVAAMRAITAERQAFASLLGEIPVTELSSTAELRACSAVKRFIARDYAGMRQDLVQARVMLSERDPAARQPTELLVDLGDMSLAAFRATCRQ
jgi:LuxR family maltose regulon positive regulatory protein